MKTPRHLAIAGAAIGVAVVAALVVYARWGQRDIVFQDPARLIGAPQAFSRDQVTAGRQLATEISLQDLVRGGYLTTNDARAFRGMDVAFFTQAQGSAPQTLLARARTRDGSYLCLLSDGSVQQVSRERYERQRATAGELGGAASPSQPVRSGTYQAPAEAGSGR